MSSDAECEECKAYMADTLADITKDPATIDFIWTNRPHQPPGVHVHSLADARNRNRQTSQ